MVGVAKVYPFVPVRDYLTEDRRFLKELREAAWRHHGEHFEGPPASMGREQGSLW